MWVATTGDESDTGQGGVRWPSIYPRLAYEDVPAAIDWLTRAFGFGEREDARRDGGDTTLAWMEHGGAVVMLGISGAHGLDSPQGIGGTSVMVNVYVDDVDEHYQRATDAGATIVMELEDTTFGLRRYEELDSEGHHWHIAQHLRDVPRD